MKNEINKDVLPDYFGHSTEAAFLDWAIVQFMERAGIAVEDKGEISYLFEVTDGSSGCGCDNFDWAEVRVEIKYEDFAIIYSGSYSGDWDDVMSLDVVQFINMGRLRF